MNHWRLIPGEALNFLRNEPSNSYDSCVTDPPYGLQFMNRHWDYDVPSAEMFAHVHRVLRPGSRMLCFAGTRTMHRMWCNIEDAGFTIEDTIMWVYAQGFPKHASKLKPAYEPICVARKGDPTDLNIDACRISTTIPISQSGAGGLLSHIRDNKPYPNSRTGEASAERRYGSNGATTFNATPGVRGGDPPGRWPANLILDDGAGAILDEQSGTLTSGTGAIQGESSRGYRPNAYGAESRPTGTPCVEYGDSGGASRFFKVCKHDGPEFMMLFEHAKVIMNSWNHNLANTVDKHSSLSYQHAVSALNDAVILASTAGRRLKNSTIPFTTVTPYKLRILCESVIVTILSFEKKLLLDQSQDAPIPNECLVRIAETPRQTDTTTITISLPRLDGSAEDVTLDITQRNSEVGAKDFELSRFKYCPKVARSEREAGLDESFVVKPLNWSSGDQNPGSFQSDGTEKASRNPHPTLKPIELMRYLCRLITPPGGRVIDPFVGSGSTGIGALLEGFDFIGIDREQDYLRIAAARIKHWTS